MMLGGGYQSVTEAHHLVLYQQSALVSFNHDSNIFLLILTKAGFGRPEGSKFTTVCVTF